MDWIKEWWTVMVGAVVGFFAGVMWVGRVESSIKELRQDVSAIQSEKFVRNESCIERRDGCGKSNKIQFDSGEKQFTEIKKLIADVDRAGNDRHNEMMKMLMDMNRHG